MIAEVTDPNNWESRSPVVASMLNPALLAAIITSAAEEFERKGDRRMPWELVFIIAPLVLHRDTRDALPRSTATHLPNWISDNPTMHAGFPERARALVPHVREGLRFALRDGVLEVDDGGLLTGSIPRKSGAANIGDIRAIIRAAGFTGRWLTKIERPSTVYGYFGVTP